MDQFSYLSKKCKAGPSKISGTGIIASDCIEKDEIIVAWGGKVVTSDQLLEFSKSQPHASQHAISIYNNLFLLTPAQDDSLESCEYFNHSCNPNAGIRGQIILIARRKIQPGEEICFDYETTQIGHSDGLPFNCKCGSSNCRSEITGKMWKDSDFQKAHRGFFSSYLEDMIEKGTY